MEKQLLQTKSAIANRKRREEKSEQIKKYNKKYRLENREKINEDQWKKRLVKHDEIIEIAWQRALDQLEKEKTAFR